MNEGIIARIDEKLDTALISIARIEENLDAALKQALDHEKRIRALENKGANRFDALIGQVIALLTAALLGGALSKLF